MVKIGKLRNNSKISKNSKNHNNSKKEDFIGFGSITSSIEGVFKPIVKPIEAIGDVFGKIYKGLMLTVKIIVWIFHLIKWLFIEFLNPINLVKDFTGSIISITKLIVISIIDVIFTLIRKSFNFIAEPLSSSLWGWDNNNNNDDKDNKKCYKTDDKHVPFSIIITTILLPPLGLLMEFGISFWVNIIICSMLTTFYYFPGLIYALLIIYK
jgi:uncharacterized membrane protein YqaE (UPF0057 family)